MSSSENDSSDDENSKKVNSNERKQILNTILKRMNLHKNDPIKYALDKQEHNKAINDPDYLPPEKKEITKDDIRKQTKIRQQRYRDKKKDDSEFKKKDAERKRLERQKKKEN